MDSAEKTDQNLYDGTICDGFIMWHKRFLKTVFQLIHTIAHWIRSRMVGVLIWILVGLISSLVLIDLLSLASANIGQIVPAGLGAIGTLILAWVTLKTLEQNRKLLEHQELEFKPSIRRIGTFTVDSGRENHVRFTLENVGYGKAVKIQFKEELYVLDMSGGSVKMEVPLNEYTNKNDNIDLPPTKATFSSLYRSDENVDSYTGDGGILESGDKARFSSRISLYNADGHPLIFDTPNSYPRIIVFENLLEGLKDSDISKIGMKFKIRYEDFVGNEYEFEMTGPAFDVNETGDLSDALDNPTWIADFPDHLVEGSFSPSE